MPKGRKNKAPLRSKHAASYDGANDDDAWRADVAAEVAADAADLASSQKTKKKTKTKPKVLKPSVAKSAAASPENAEKQQDELDALMAIYDQDFVPVTVSKATAWGGVAVGEAHRFQLRIVPVAGGGDDDNHVRVLLDITLPHQYPDKAPSVRVLKDRGLSDEQLASLQHIVDAAVATSVVEDPGDVMCYQIGDAAVRWCAVCVPVSVFIRRRFISLAYTSSLSKSHLSTTNFATLSLRVRALTFFVSNILRLSLLTSLFMSLFSASLCSVSGSSTATSHRLVCTSRCSSAKRRRRSVVQL
jgi:hypothetical protein